MMEPMTLGSPTHSPSNSPNTSFLPPFLLGEFNQPTSPRTNSLSPTKGRTLAFGNSPPIKTPQQQVPQYSTQYSTPLRQKNIPNVSFSNKINGPPTQGLFDTLHQPDWNSSKPQSPTSSFLSPQHNTTFGQQSQDTYFAQVGSPFIGSTPKLQSQQTTGLNQSNLNQSSVLSNNNENICPASTNSTLNVESLSNDENSEYWVTVFGFPPSAAGMILTQFSNCGNILEKKFPPQGNWIWIRFSSRSETSRAVAMNGRVLPGNLMIGVEVCKQSPNSGNRSSVRQLTSPRIQNTSTSSIGTPSNIGAQRSSSTISRALEYVFGW